MAHTVAFPCDTDPRYVAHAWTCEMGQCRFSALDEDHEKLIAGCCAGNLCEYSTSCVEVAVELTASHAPSTDVLTWYDRKL